jgi:RNA polymerase sigma factor (sigma-70 family)
MKNILFDTLTDNTFRKSCVIYAQRMGMDRDVAEEILQNVAIRVAKNSTYNPEQPPKAYLGTIFRHDLIDYLRQNQRRLSNTAQYEGIARERITSPPQNPLETLIEREEEEFECHKIQTLREAIMNLKENHRRVISTLLEGLTYSEISERLGIPLGSVKRIIHEAKPILRMGMVEVEFN